MLLLDQEVEGQCTRFLKMTTGHMGTKSSNLHQMLVLSADHTCLGLQSEIQEWCDRLTHDQSVWKSTHGLSLKIHLVIHQDQQNGTMGRTCQAKLGLLLRQLDEMMALGHRLWNQETAVVLYEVTMATFHPN